MDAMQNAHYASRLHFYWFSYGICVGTLIACARAWTTVFSILGGLGRAWTGLGRGLDNGLRVGLDNTFLIRCGCLGHASCAWAGAWVPILRLTKRLRISDAADGDEVVTTIACYGFSSPGVPLGR